MAGGAGAEMTRPQLHFRDGKSNPWHRTLARVPLDINVDWAWMTPTEAQQRNLKLVGREGLSTGRRRGVDRRGGGGQDGKRDTPNPTT